MFKRHIHSAIVVVLVAGPLFAQPKGRVQPLPQIPEPIQAKASFRALFKPVVEAASRSTVRVEVDGSDIALGTVVADSYVVTKASDFEVKVADVLKKSKTARVSIKTHDGREYDAKEAATSEAFDLALLKVDGSGLLPVTLGNSADAPAGNWIAVAGAGVEPVAVGVVGAGPRTISPPYRGKVPLAESGFLGVQLASGATRATIGSVTKDSAAEKAGIQSNDTILQVEGNDIIDQETLINTLQTYRTGDKVRIKLERDGKTLELSATLGKRTADLLKGGNRGDFQNQMGSALSDRRSGIPRFLQTDAVVKPRDCGSPVVDLDGHVIGLMIARAGRTESHVIPAETVKELLPILVAAAEAGTIEKRIQAARQALTKAEDGKAIAPVVSEGRRLLGLVLAEEKWWKDHPLEKAPMPHVIDTKLGPAPRTVIR